MYYQWPLTVNSCYIFPIINLKLLCYSLGNWHLWCCWAIRFLWNEILMQCLSCFYTTLYIVASVCSLTLWIGHLSRHTTEEVLREELEKHGKVTQMSVNWDFFSIYYSIFITQMSVNSHFFSIYHVFIAFINGTFKNLFSILMFVSVWKLELS